MTVSFFSAAPPDAIPAAALRGRAIGALVTAGFGSLWMIIAAKFWKRLDWRVWVAIGALTVLLWLAAARQIQLPQPMPRAQTFTLHVSRLFGVVLTLEWIPIVVAVVVLNRVRRPDLILPVIALVVGLHFIPLAWIFGTLLFYFTGIAMVVTTLAALRIRQPELRLAVVCTGCGLALWLTSAILLL